MSKTGDTADAMLNYVAEMPIRLDINCTFDAGGTKVKLTAWMHPSQEIAKAIKGDAK